MSVTLKYGQLLSYLDIDLDEEYLVYLFQNDKFDVSKPYSLSFLCLRMYSEVCICFRMCNECLLMFLMKCLLYWFLWLIEYHKSHYFFWFSDSPWYSEKKFFVLEWRVLFLKFSYLWLEWNIYQRKWNFMIFF